VRTGCLLLLCWAGVAAAAEGESAISVVPGFAALSVHQGQHERSGVGGGGLVDYQRSFSDTWWFRAAAGGALLDIDGTAYEAVGTVGVTYTIDVFRYVPYVGVGAGAAVIGGGSVKGEVRPYVELGVGVDVLVGRAWSWGVDVRFSSFVSQYSTLIAGPKFALRWGYF
jgi:hypothetical protein